MRILCYKRYTSGKCVEVGENKVRRATLLGGTPGHPRKAPSYGPSFNIQQRIRGIHKLQWGSLKMHKNVFPHSFFFTLGEISGCNDERRGKPRRDDDKRRNFGVRVILARRDELVLSLLVMLGILGMKRKKNEGTRTHHSNPYPEVSSLVLGRPVLSLRTYGLLGVAASWSTVASTRHSWFSHWFLLQFYFDPW